MENARGWADLFSQEGRGNKQATIGPHLGQHWFTRILLSVGCQKSHKTRQYGGKGAGFEARQGCDEIQAQSLAGCVTLGKVLHLSEPVPLSV